MSEFTRIAAVDELPPGKGMEALVGDRAIALFNVDGQFFSIANRCVHRGGPLGQGYVEVSTVTFPWHAWMFDVKSGCNVVNGDMKVASFEVKVEDGQVFVRVE
jgi:nitrite reductase/ring-hydroxylating ferredoxin subunit